MIQEFLVILACSQNQGCTEATAQYYSMNPQVKAEIRIQENRLKNIAGPELTAFSSIIIFAYKQQGTFHLAKHFELQVPDIHTQIVSFKYEF